jgi:hypothetical protein
VSSSSEWSKGVERGRKGADATRGEEVTSHFAVMGRPPVALVLLALALALLTFVPGARAFYVPLLSPQSWKEDQEVRDENDSRL